MEDTDFISVSYDFRLSCWCGEKYNWVRRGGAHYGYDPLAPIRSSALRCPNGHWMSDPRPTNG